MAPGTAGGVGDLVPKLVVEVHNIGIVPATRQGMEEKRVEEGNQRTKDVILNPVVLGLTTQMIMMIMVITTGARAGLVGEAGHLVQKAVVEEQNQDIGNALEEAAKLQAQTEPPVTQTHAQLRNALGGGNSSRTVVTNAHPI